MRVGVGAGAHSPWASPSEPALWLSVVQRGASATETFPVHT